MKTVSIFGVGLIGGSFALAIRKAGFTGTILGVSSLRTLRRAQELGAIDRAATPREAAAEADLIFLAQPVQTILTTIPTLAGDVREETLVTDAGSTKASIVQAGAAAFPKRNFLGGHPLAGKERQGIDSADADLFEGRTWVLTPDNPESLKTTAAQSYLNLLGAIGAQTVVLPATEHDRILAFTSHLPQLASTALAAALEAELGSASMDGHPLFGPALLDSTRLALSPFSVWNGILATNQEQIRAALQCYIIKLQELMTGLCGDASIASEDAFRAAAKFSRLLREPKP